MNAFARLALPKMADWCVIDILEADGQIYRRVFAEPSKLSLARRLDRRHRLDPARCRGPSRVVRTGHAEIYPTLRDATFISLDDEEQALFRELGIESAMCLPLMMTPRRSWGAVTLVSADASRPYHVTDLVVARILTRRLAVSLESAALYEAEQFARQEAEAANRSKDEFLAMLSHELRNPLGAIRNAVLILNRTGAQDSQEAKRMHGLIARQTAQLGRLIDDLLDVAQLTAGKVVLHRAAVDLRVIAKRSVTSLSEAGRAGRHHISLAGDAVIVEADATRLEQVIQNLVENAIKHTASGGRIDVVVERAEKEAILRVRDTGEGIPAALLPKIFDLFVQAPQPLARSQGGLGIGLSLVQRLVGLHGGTVSAWSAGTGQGSEFVVRLPLPVPLDAATSRESGPVAPPMRGPRHIVIIEDNRDFRDSLRGLLEVWGHRVEEAADGRRGLERILASRPDFALIDLGLPSLDGYAVARAIRADPVGQRICLVAVTGYGRPQDRGRALDAGFDGFLVKPVDEEQLMRALEIVRTEPATEPADAAR